MKAFGFWLFTLCVAAGDVYMLFYSIADWFRTKWKRGRSKARSKTWVTAFCLILTAIYIALYVDNDIKTGELSELMAAFAVIKEYLLGYLLSIGGSLRGKAMLFISGLFIALCLFEFVNFIYFHIPSKEKPEDYIHASGLQFKKYKNMDDDE